MIELVYLLVAILFQVLYSYLFEYIRTDLNKTDYYESVMRFHKYIFIVLQLFLGFFISDFLISLMYFAELIISIVNIYVIYKLYNIATLNFYDFLIHNSERNKILLLLVLPVIIMNFIRNYFDTYTIGMIVFSLSNVAILLWQVSIISFINIYNIFSKTHINKYGIILFALLYYFLKLFFPI